MPTEEAQQAHVVKTLRDYLPEEMAAYWSATMNGVRLPSPRLIQTAQAQGLNPGPLDLMFLWPDGITTFIEMKKAGDPDSRVKKNRIGGQLRPEQQLWAARLGEERFALCHCWPEVFAVLDPLLKKHGLRWLTDTEAFRRSEARAAAKRANQKPRTIPHGQRKPPPRRLERPPA